MITADQIINLQPGDTLAQTNPRGEVIGPVRALTFVGPLLPRGDKRPWRMVEWKTDAGKPVILGLVSGMTGFTIGRQDSTGKVQVGSEVDGV